MITRLAVSTILVFAVLSGGVLGWRSTPTAHASVDTLYLYIQAGTEAGTADMTCAWHSVCTSQNAGPIALDWGQGAESPVYWRSWASYIGPATGAGSVIASQQNTEYCHRVRARMKRPDATDLGDVFFTHSYSPVGGEFAVGAGSIWSPYETVRRVAATIAKADEFTGCSITEAHIHQDAAAPFARNTSYYSNNYPPDNIMYGVDVNSQSAYQNYVSYQY